MLTKKKKKNVLNIKAKMATEADLKLDTERNVTVACVNRPLYSTVQYICDA